MTNLEYSSKTLANGLRIIHIPRSGDVSYCGMCVNAGSRDESMAQSGLAHFVEHTLFKGTLHRKSWHILNRMESVGGELNAYTTKEGTTLYSIFPNEYLERSVELLADLICNSQFPEHELEKEREVVLDEIDSYLDTPSEAIYDDFEDMLFAGSGIGHNILGTAECLNKISGDDARRYIMTQYTPDNMVFFSMGNTPFARVLRLAEKYFAHLHHSLSRVPRETPIICAPFNASHHCDNHQSHAIMGTRTVNMYDERRYPLLLLNNILGGPGMNSRLNVTMRERRGLVYTVESSLSLFTDCGYFAVYFGCDHCHVEQCGDIVRRELDMLCNRKLSQTQLSSAIRQYIGQMLVSTDNNENTSLAFGKSFLYQNNVLSAEEINAKFKAVTASDIMQAANELRDSGMSSLIFD